MAGSQLSGDGGTWLPLAGRQPGPMRARCELALTAEQRGTAKYPQPRHLLAPPPPLHRRLLAPTFFAASMLPWLRWAYSAASMQKPAGQAGRGRANSGLKTWQGGGGGRVPRPGKHAGRAAKPRHTCSVQRWSTAA